MDGSAQLTEVRFSRKRQGYDPDEVDNFLERIGERVYELQESVRASSKRLEDTQAQLAAAGEKLAVAERKASEAERRLSSGGPSGSSAPSPSGSDQVVKSAAAEDLEETLKNTLVLAQRTADTAVKEATAEAERIRGSAKADAERLARQTDEACQAKLDKAEGEARQRIDSASGPIKTEVLRLEELQKRLSGETRALESNLAAQRARIREALSTLQAVVDDPAKFAPDPSAVAPATPTSNATPAAPKAAAPTAAAATPARPAPRPAVSRTDTAPVASSAPGGKPLEARPRPGLESRPTAGSAAQAAAVVRPTVTTPRPADEGGPPTASIDLTSDAPAVDDDNFLEQLRRAVGETDPADETSEPADDAMQAFFEQQDGDLESPPRRARFGRRN
jgi:DivIVA domain-containing protein